MDSIFPQILHPLQQLKIYDNKLSGDIPNQIFRYLDNLIVIFLHNNFLRGRIPLFLGSLRSLEILDISNNSFSSTIPFELENLTLLNVLDLSFNDLYGEVPIRGVFSNVSVISLTGNKNLCGGVPQLRLPAWIRAPSKKHKRSLKN